MPVALRARGAAFGGASMSMAGLEETEMARLLLIEALVEGCVALEAPASVRLVAVAGACAVEEACADTDRDGIEVVAGGRPRPGGPMRLLPLIAAASPLFTDTGTAGGRAGTGGGRCCTLVTIDGAPNALTFLGCWLATEGVASAPPRRGLKEGLILSAITGAARFRSPDAEREEELDCEELTGASNTVEDAETG